MPPSETAAFRNPLQICSSLCRVLSPACSETIAVPTASPIRSVLASASFATATPCVCNCFISENVDISSALTERSRSR
jgi:hypothetical protein